MNKIIYLGKKSDLSDNLIQGETIDLGGSLLFPGVVDPHVHFRDPGLTQKENFFTGSRAAVAGGITTVCDMPNTEPPTDSLDNFNEKKKIGEAKSLVDFGLHAMLIESLEERKKLGSAGVTSFKLYPEISDDSNVLTFRDEKEIVSIHPEDPRVLGEHVDTGGDFETFLQSRPKQAEISEINKILGSAAGSHLHFCHLTARESLDLIGKENKKITCEVTPHHLLLDRSHLQEFGPIAKTYPPLRTRKDRKALLEGLEDGMIDIVATDHAPHTSEEKEKGLMEAPPGIAGIETSLPLIYTLVEKGKLSLYRLVEAMCLSPAKIFGLVNDEGIPKGALLPGADADLVALDHEQKWEIKGRDLHGKTKFTPFEGQEVSGRPFLTLVRGEIVFRDGYVTGEEGHGKFLPKKE
ncbi:hypothetical protein AKJ57_03905 [candidate division MSBL1 archaeon SCGC-AAA259A05]|uniref:Amidohydrolase-related domain-containing protein n=1 Tax=candidate division MSBL1 archaeon SCGC-AAA259A05 TaxID=1698259 RepID=A0A133U9C8_9EURY|nr:hypothetical protein AKJ57_03905 [candidate division MSBL1 archaeon SCGC-AAA259A05]